jgi:hypothetical protein
MGKRSTSPEDMTLGTRLFLGGLCAAAGLMVEAMGLGVIPTEPGSIHAPPWVILTAGAMFALVGLWILSVGTPVGEVLKHAVGPLVLVGMLSILHWIAFGPGVRRCSGGISIPFLSAGGPAGDLECRIAFGYGAILFDGLILGAMLSTWAEKRLDGGWQRVAKGVGNTLILVPLSPLVALALVVMLLKAGWKLVRGSRGSLNAE